jgi:hypothetical protein
VETWKGTIWFNIKHPCTPTELIFPQKQKSQAVRLDYYHHIGGGVHLNLSVTGKNVYSDLFSQTDKSTFFTGSGAIQQAKN